MRILVIDDDEFISKAVRGHSVGTGCVCDWVGSIADAEAASRSIDYGLILLELEMPDGDGLVFLKHFRGRGGNAPVIVLTGRDQICDRIASLNAGADDFLVKPFDLGELEARILAIRRRCDEKRQTIVHLSDIQIERSTNTILIGGKQIQLTPREWALLDLLVERPGKIVTQERIKEALCAFGDGVENNTVQVYISRLRKKVGVGRIRTAHGIGYLLTDR